MDRDFLGICQVTNAIDKFDETRKIFLSILSKYLYGKNVEEVKLKLNSPKNSILSSPEQVSSSLLTTYL